MYVKPILTQKINTFVDVINTIFFNVVNKLNKWNIMGGCRSKWKRYAFSEQDRWMDYGQITEARKSEYHLMLTEVHLVPYSIFLCRYNVGCANDPNLEYVN